MALYELRTYTLYVGKMAEATKLYQELGYPALEKGGHHGKLIGYFQPIAARSTNSCTYGNSTTTAIGASTGPACSRTRTSWKVLPQNSGRW